VRVRVVLLTSAGVTRLVLLPGAECGFQTHLTPPLPHPPHRTEEEKKERNDLITEPSPRPRGDRFFLSLKIKLEKK